MPAQTLGLRTAEFLVSESSGYQSRDEVTITTADSDWPAGTVLAIVTGDYKRYDGAAVSPGNVAVGVLYDAIDSGATGKRTIINRNAEVNFAHLLTTNATGLEASLALLGIKVRKE
jgi:hypothetical protein